MRAFGLLSLLITIAIAAWWFTSVGPASDSETVDVETYQESIEAAKAVAELLEN